MIRSEKVLTYIKTAKLSGVCLAENLAALRANVLGRRDWVVAHSASEAADCLKRQDYTFSTSKPLVVLLAISLEHLHDINRLATDAACWVRCDGKCRLTLGLRSGSGGCSSGNNNAVTTKWTSSLESSDGAGGRLIVA